MSPRAIRGKSDKKALSMSDSYWSAAFWLSLLKRTFTGGLLTKRSSTALRQPETEKIDRNLGCMPAGIRPRECPFCGCFHVNTWTRGDFEYYIMCPRCLSRGPAAGSVESSASLWNRRIGTTRGVLYAKEGEKT